MPVIDVDISTLGSVIKTAYEAEADTNAFTDAEKSKLAGVDDNATDDQTGAEIKAAYEAEADTNAFTDADHSKLDGIESGATADQSDAEIEAGYNNRVDVVSQGEAEGGVATIVKRWTAQRVRQAIEAFTQAFTSADRTKLDGIEDNATADQSDAEIEAGYNNQVAVVSQVDAEAGTSTDVKRWTPERVAQAIAALAAGGGGGLSAKFKTGAYTAVSGDVIFADTSGGAFTITLPATPDAEDSVSIFDVGQAAVENITIDRNGETIDGVAENFVIDENHGQVQLIYTGSDWEVAIVTPGSGLTEAQVVEITSGTKRLFLKPSSDLIATSATTSEELEPDTFWAMNGFVCTPSSDASAFSWVTTKPRNYVPNSIRFRVYWYTDNTDTGVVQWDFATVPAVGDGEAFSNTNAGGDSTNNTASGVSNAVHISDWMEPPDGVPDWIDDDVVSFWFRRHGTDVADTYTGNATVFGVEVEYQTNAPTED